MSAPRFSLVAVKVDHINVDYYSRDNSTPDGKLTKLDRGNKKAAEEFVAHQNRQFEAQLLKQEAALAAFVRGAATRHPMPWTIDDGVVRDREGVTILEGTSPDVLALVLKMMEE